MNGLEYQKCIDRLGMSRANAAEFLGVNSTTSRRWTTDVHAIPDSVAMLLLVMIRYNLTPNSVGALLTKHKEAA
jgi:hypothetical protein